MVGTASIEVKGHVTFTYHFHVCFHHVPEAVLGMHGGMHVILANLCPSGKGLRAYNVKRFLGFYNISEQECTIIIHI